MRGDDGTDVVDAHFAVDLAELLLDRPLGRLGVLGNVGIADEHLAAVVQAVLGVHLHFVEDIVDGVALAAHLVIGDDPALVVEAKDRADVQDRGDRGSRAGHAAAAAEIF